MKIHNAKAPVEVERPQQKGTDAASTVVARGDRVTVAQSDQVLQTIQAARKEAVDARTERLRRIGAAVRGGSYRPNPLSVAEEMMAAAESDARLRTLYRA